MIDARVLNRQEVLPADLAAIRDGLLAKLDRTPEEIARDNPVRLLEQLDEATRLYEEAGQIEADATILHDLARALATAEFGPETSATALRIGVDGATALEAGLLKAASNHKGAMLARVDAIRTIVSYMKQQMAMNGYGR